MGQPTWKLIAEVVIPEREGCRWTPALDYPTPGRLYRIRVQQQKKTTAGEDSQAALQDQEWQPESDSGAKCSSDGDPTISRKNGVCPMADVNVGALIARIGGSSADAAGDKDKTALFSVGRHCVFQAPDSPRIGTLFLGINDTPSNAPKLKGQLKVSIDEAL